MPGALIDVTEKAAAKGLELLGKAGFPKGAVRLKVTSGGCSGFSYNLEPVDGAPEKGENVVESHGLKVYLPSKSLLYVAGTTLDYEQSLMTRRFIFKNPNAKSSCSCGESFAI